MLLQQHMAEPLNAFCFLPIEPGGLDVTLQLCGFYRNIILRSFVFFIERLAQRVHALIRTLCTEDRDDQEIKCCAMTEECFRRIVDLVEFFVDDGEGDSTGHAHSVQRLKADHDQM